MANSVRKLQLRKLFSKTLDFLAYLSTQPMFTGDAAGSPFHPRHTRELDKEAGT